MRDLDAQLGELTQVLDRLVNPVTVLSDIEAQLHRLFDVGIVAPLAASGCGELSVRPSW